MTEAADFVDAFTAGWSRGREGLLGEFMSRVDEDVVLHQPLLPPAQGRAGFRAMFERLFAAVPDLRGEVLRWGATSDGVTIELALRGTLGGRPLEWVTLDRIVLREGRLLERQAYFDPLPLVRAALSRPRAAARLLAGRGAAATGGRAGGGAPGSDGARAFTGAARGASAGGARSPLIATLGGDRALAGLAAGRLALGALGRLAPRRATHAFGAGHAASGELDYMSRVFGIRAIALGTGYLSSGGDARRRWQRLAFMCDVSDTIAGAGHLRRRDMPLGSAIALTALTGGYALVGAARIARDAAP